MSLRVTLSWYEVTFAAHVGLRRYLDVRENGGRNRWRADNHDDGWDRNIEGAIGEMAVAKALGIFWSASIGTYRNGADVGLWQVRTRRKDFYQLLVRPSDPDDVRFYHVKGRSPSFEIVGWMLGKDAKRSEWLREYGGPPAAYFVPDEYLNPVEPAARWRNEIDQMLREIGDTALVEQVDGYVREWPGMLLDAHDRVCKRLDAVRQQRAHGG